MKTVRVLETRGSNYTTIRNNCYLNNHAFGPHSTSVCVCVRARALRITLTANINNIIKINQNNGLAVVIDRQCVLCEVQTTFFEYN